METVAAAENLTIEMTPDSWRLYVDDLHGAHELLDAVPDGRLRYSEAFADSRRLPASGTLANANVEHILLGWSPSDEAWHLGLLLAPQLASLRDSRWCELAHWPDPDQGAFRELAENSGLALASVAGRPFRLIEPEAPATIAAERELIFEEEPPAPAEIPLPRLPLDFSGDWSLETGTTGMLQLVRNPRVARASFRRSLWYAFWAAVFVFLLVASHLSGIAPPGQPWIPPLALLSALALLALVVRNQLRFHNSPDLYIFDSYQMQIRARHGMRVLWSKRVAQIQSLYVSEVRQKRRRGGAPAYAELNLHLSTGQFQYLVPSRQLRLLARESMTLETGVSELHSWHCNSNAQAVALYVGKALELPVWLDRRDS
ncbi:MAG: hypothetical protein OXF44_12635 [Anaerolineaceae bacterium]|nr:hypothetical protein [Anaerolineaceae bacterium]